MSSRRATFRRSGGPAARGAFTLVELLVVITVIGILVALVVTLGLRATHNQKVQTTRNTMRLVRMAIDQFATEDPLRAQYDNPNLRDPKDLARLIGRTFGPYPPYQLAKAFLEPSVATTLEPVEAHAAGDYNLLQRLGRDINAPSGSSEGELKAKWVYIEHGTIRDDIRALYTYLALYSPGVLAQIPPETRQNLGDCDDPVKWPEAVNPTGQGTYPGDPGVINVFGLFDAWGVALDYFLQVRVEYALRPDGTPGWLVTDRVPVLRSRALTPEEADAEALAGGTGDPGRWVFSEPFPQPAAPVDPVTGEFKEFQAGASGWVRAVAAGDPNDTTRRDNYGFVPE